MRQIKACVDILLPPNLRAEADRLAVQENRANAEAGRTTRFWRPGRLLRVRFLGGEAQVQRRVLGAASVWLRYANLAFELSHDVDAEVRIGFTPGATWSSIGADALVVPWDQPTANFGWLHRATSGQTLNALVLHVFGHILGLEHVHYSPTSPIPWARAAVYAYYAALPTPWTPAEVDRQLFAAYDHDVAPYATADSASIMTLPIPEEFTQGRFSVAWPTDLSEADIASIARRYPHGAHSGAPWHDDELVVMPDSSTSRDIPRNGGAAPTYVEAGYEMLPVAGIDEALDFSGGASERDLPMAGLPDGPVAADDTVAKSADDTVAKSLQPATLRLDVAVPEKAQIGRAFQVAVAVRQPSSPALVAPGLPVVQSGEAQVVWLSEPFLRLRVEVSAPECTFDGPNSKTFRLFPRVDSPVFYFNLTPKVVGTINIVVNLYQEEDTLGSAGTNTLITEQPVGDVTLKLESAPVASKPAAPSTLASELAAARGALAGALAHIYFDQASIRRIVIDSGLDPSHIAFDNRADNSWSDVLREAVLQDRVEAIITIASREYPTAADLQTAILAFHQVTA